MKDRKRSPNGVDLRAELTFTEDGNTPEDIVTVEIFPTRVLGILDVGAGLVAEEVG